MAWLPVTTGVKMDERPRDHCAICEMVGTKILQISEKWTREIRQRENTHDSYACGKRRFCESLTVCLLEIVLPGDCRWETDPGETVAAGQSEYSILSVIIGLVRKLEGFSPKALDGDAQLAPAGE